MTKTQIVILGGGYSGLMAARRLAYQTRGQQVAITLVNGADHFVERIRLHQLVAHQNLRAYPFRDILAKTGVTFVHGWATALQTSERAVTIKTADGLRAIHYDHLIYALGSLPDTTRVAGVADYTLPVGAESTSMQLRARMPEVAARSGQLVVVGGGLTGIESATEMAESDPTLKVTLVTCDRFGSELSEAGAAHVRQVFARLGIKIIDQTRVKSVTAHTLQTDNGAMTFDLCLWAGPFTVPSLAREAGLTVNDGGQALVDSHLRSVSHPEIAVVGDAADLTGAVEAPIRMACATALPMGAYAADDLAARLRGKAHRPYDFAYSFRCISLGRRDGLIQFVDADDQPKKRIFTGWLAARFKELICRSTVWQIRHEHWMIYTHHPKSTQSPIRAASQSW